MSPLSDAERLRYARHFTLPEFGEAGQERLRAAKVLCVGAGGLGSPVLMYLAAAGVGTLGVVEADTVDASNLQRQLLYGTAAVGRKKLDAAADRLHDLNPHVSVVKHDTLFTRDNALELLKGYDLVIDGTDNFATRYLCNDAAVLSGKTNVYGSIFRFEGQASVFAPHLGGPCYRCLFPEPPPPGAVPSCAEGGVLGVLPGLVGAIQATEAIKAITGLGETLMGRLLHIDALTMRFREIRLRRDPLCPWCGDGERKTELGAYDFLCSGPSAAPATAAEEIGVSDFAQWRASGRPYTLVDVREPAEVAHSRFPDSIAIPLGEIAQRFSEIPRPSADRPLVVHCKSGGRSGKAAAFLRENGYTPVLNLTGGLIAWSQQVDPALKPL